MKRPQVTVIGSHEESRFMVEAYEIGRHIARRNWILVCGGRGGIMEAASRGASAEGGIVVGILPGVDFNDANPYLTAAIASGIGFARNSMNVLSGDVVVAIGGRTGTMSELSYAFQYGRPMIICSFADGWSAGFADLALREDDRSLIHMAATPTEAMDTLDALLGGETARS
ncbi:MAG TPA: TIGR00725 family protein [Spirochaetota bacterium]|nr:TIGR00725 family protein [Spirochaetota bacterium]HNU90423.1 TIGR00725 family protein [Spirochaetota bacterium]